MTVLAADLEVDRLELDLMESDEEDSVELAGADRVYQFRMARTFPHTGDEEERSRGGAYTWQREKY